ncbi:MAG: DUF3179 domain-containing protein [Planctomycetota bacterium]
MKKPRKPFMYLAAFGLAVTGVVGLARRQQAEPDSEVTAKPTKLTWDERLRAEAGDFTILLGEDPDKIGYALMRINNRWHDATAVMLLETLRFAPNGAAARGSLELLRRRLGVDHGTDLDAWYRHVWSLPEPTYKGYAQFKADFYGGIVDESFQEYFSEDRRSTIRLDEVRWGGVKRNGIPPLDRPAMLSADEADYLDDQDVVFGITGGGRAKAYPKRILAWHEMIKDSIAGEPITGVYCTLCGAVIIYKSTAGEIEFDFGTSGFLYRSNKLMFDESTKSLWSSLTGKPVIGPLAGNGLRLDTLPVVTTTWGQWKRRHPETLVLSLETGHKRDYGEGVAYRDYFASPDVMFAVPKLDERLAAKAEVLIVRDRAAQDRPKAIAIDFLKKNPVHHETIGDRNVVMVTDRSGATRVYDAGGKKFRSAEDGELLDESEARWIAEESGLSKADGGSAESLQRLPAHRAFWFAWSSQHPETELVR